MRYARSVSVKGWQGPTPRRLELAGEVKRLRDEQIRRGEQSWARIALDLGISPSYASELYVDPDGSRSRARKDRYSRSCPDCGDPMSGSDGLTGGPDYCADCAPAHSRVWTRDVIIAAFQEFHREWGHAPSSNLGTILCPSQRGSAERLAEAAQNTVRLPYHSVVKAEFGSWPAAIEAAGLSPLPRERRRRRSPTSTGHQHASPRSSSPPTSSLPPSGRRDP